MYIDYRYGKMRIDSAVLTADGRIVLKKGTPHTSMPEPPALAAGETRLANIFISGRLDALTVDNLFPILETAYPEPAATGLVRCGKAAAQDHEEASVRRAPEDPRLGR